MLMLKIKKESYHLVFKSTNWYAVCTIILFRLCEEWSQPVLITALEKPCVSNLTQPMKTPDTWSAIESYEQLSAYSKLKC